GGRFEVACEDTREVVKAYSLLELRARAADDQELVEVQGALRACAPAQRGDGAQADLGDLQTGVGEAGELGLGLAAEPQAQAPQPHVGAGGALPVEGDLLGEIADRD